MHSMELNKMMRDYDDGEEIQSSKAHAQAAKI